MTRLYYGRWTYKYESAARHGAAGVIIVHTTPSAGYPWQVVQSSWGGEQFELPAEGEPRIQLKGWATEDAARRLVKAGGPGSRQADRRGEEAAASSRCRSRLRTSIRFDNKVSRVRTANVAGVLPGSDPKLKDEVVIYSAHHDHFGIGDPDTTGDNIYNGAEDNAAGCAQVLAIARAMAALPERPRRSVLMLFVAGEEQGLLGSKYYSLHPTFAPGKIAANINYDGGNYRGRTRDLTQIGARQVLAGRDREGAGREAGPRAGAGPVPGQGLLLPLRPVHFRQDRRAGAVFRRRHDFIGKPAGWGKHAARRMDRTRLPPAERRDRRHLGVRRHDRRRDRLASRRGWLVAQADAMPTWNPGDEFEAARKKALAASNGDQALFLGNGACPHYAIARCSSLRPSRTP